MTENKHPTPAAIRIVADRLERMIPETPTGNLYMDEHEVYKESHDCGTLACHGGLYAAEHALRNTDTHFFKTVQNSSTPLAYLHKKVEEDIHAIEWEDGAMLMATDLGFENREDLEGWAYEYTDLWGNNFGHEMFKGPEAFDEKEYMIKVELIVTWWRAVANRIEARNHAV